MKLQTNVSFKQYLQLMFKLTYQKTMLRLLMGVAVILLLWIIVYHFQIFNLPKPLIYQYITLVLIVVVQPLIVLNTVYRNYHSSNQLRETLDMELTDEMVKIRRETFYTEIQWVQIHRFSEKKRWFLIYQNNLSAIIIPKRSLTEDQICRLREILAQAETTCEQGRKQMSL